jgi:hypothetical protein
MPTIAPAAMKPLGAVMPVFNFVLEAAMPGCPATALLNLFPLAINGSGTSALNRKNAKKIPETWEALGDKIFGPDLHQQLNQTLPECVLRRRRGEKLVEKLVAVKSMITISCGLLRSLCGWQDFCQPI